MKHTYSVQPFNRPPGMHLYKQSGVVMIFALLVLLSLTLLGIASVSNGLIQTKMASAMEQQSFCLLYTSPSPRD